MGNVETKDECAIPFKQNIQTLWITHTGRRQKGTLVVYHFHGETGS